MSDSERLSDIWASQNRDRTEDKPAPRKCLRCDGRGWVSVAVGYDWRNEKCPDCKGSGERVGNA